MDETIVMRVDQRQEALRQAVIEAHRFIRKAEAAHAALDDPEARHFCPDLAAAKRASMDLTKALVPVRQARA